MTNAVSTQAADADLIRWIKRVNVGVIILGVVLLAVPAVGYWWVSRQLPTVNTVSIDNVQMLSPDELCPGDPLTFSYDFHAKGAGLLIRDMTLWQVDPPPRTLIYSTARRFILDGPIDQHLIETWHIPQNYLDYQTEKVIPLPPGGYRRYLAISSPSRSTVVAITSVDFEIREDCE